MDGVAIERRLREFFKARAASEGIAAAWLFGSVARGTTRPDSDVDVGVLFREDPPRTLAGYRFDLEADLQELLGHTRDHLDDLLAFVRAIRERLASE